MIKNKKILAMLLSATLLCNTGVQTLAATTLAISGNEDVEVLVDEELVNEESEQNLELEGEGTFPAVDEEDRIAKLFAQVEIEDEKEAVEIVEYEMVDGILLPIGEDGEVSNSYVTSVPSPEVIIEEAKPTTYVDLGIEECDHTTLCAHAILEEVGVTAIENTIPTGAISATVRFDTPATAVNIAKRNIEFKLLKSGESLGSIELSEGYKILSGYEVKIEAINMLGSHASEGDLIRNYNIELKGVEAGEYTIELAGDNYATFQSDILDISNYSKHITVGTSDATFTHGDVTGDNLVNSADLDALKAEIMANKTTKDLNGDGVIDIMDITMVNLNINALGDAVLFDTSMVGVSQKLDLEQLALALESISVEGFITDLFQVGNDSPVMLSNAEGVAVSEENPIVLPLEFNETVEMTQVNIVTPKGLGSIQEGTLEVTYIEDEEEKVMYVPFSQDDIEEQAISLARTTSTNTITINLGTRVAVKKISVSVEQVEGSTTEFVVVQEVTFIKDIIPEDPDASNALIENIKVVEVNKGLNISWDKADNVGGYRIRYGETKGNPSFVRETSVNSISLSGLENLTDYYFTIEATSGTWSGTPSAELMATPQPSARPGAPMYINVEPFDQSIKLSWTEGMDTETFNIYLKKTEEADSEYVKIVEGLTGPAYEIKNLVNGTSYTFKISGTNCIGEGAACTPIEATPEAIKVEPPMLPIADQLPVSNITKISMSNSSNVNTSDMPNGFSVSNVADGDFDTFWVAANYWDSSAFTFEFEQAYDMSYLLYTPRIYGSYPYSIDHYSIRVWSEGDDLSGSGTLVASTLKASRRTDENGTIYYVMEFDFTEDVVKLMVSTGETTGGPRVSISEVTFYEHNSLDSDVKALFTDDSFTAIKSSVTQEELDELQARLDALPDYVVNKEVIGDEIRFAVDLLNGVDGFGYVKDDFVQIDNSKDDRTLSGISPLGVVGLARTDLAIYADIPDGGTLTIMPSQYFAGPGTFGGVSLNLVNGRNIIRVEDLTNVSGAIEGGVYYYKYTGPNVEDVKIHVLNYTGVYSGINTVKEVIAVPTLELYDLGLIENADETEVRKRMTAYIEALEIYEGKNTSAPTQDPVNSTDISTSSVLLSIPASGVWSNLGGSSTTTSEKVDKLMNTVLAWDELVYITNTAYGDEPGERQGRQNFRYMKMSATAYMYAAGDHVGIQFGSTGEVINCSPTPENNQGSANPLPGWGVAHEIGHNLDRLGKLEITNNIYASLAKAWDGGMGLNTGRVDYAQVYQKVSVGGPGVPNGFFVQLGMYWQLHLAYANENVLEFYTAFNKALKNGEFSEFSGDNRTAVIASNVAGKDLTEFFTVWGVSLTEEAIEEMKKFPAEERKIQYLDDSARVYRLTSGRSGITSVDDYTITAGFDSENQKLFNMTINHTMDNQDLQGFEVYRDDYRIAFITPDSQGECSYQDLIGSLNNAAFEYSVQAVDKLGNLVGDRVYTEQVRIEYDDIIPSSAYTMEAVDGGFKYTFNEATTTSGFIINNQPATGEFEVTIAVEVDEDGDGVNELKEHQTAKSGDFTINETLTGDKFKNYYHKAGADSSDRTIGVYDAKEIIITGIPSGEDVEFIGAVGDNVAFTDYMIGRIGHDFDTGAGVLEEGDIIIIGEYIGDPYFNEIVLQGKFAVSSTDEVNVEYVERAMAGDTYMFATVPENGMVSVITDGLFIFKPDVQNEADLQGTDGITCGGVSILPAQMKAVMNRTSDTGTRQTSDTIWVTTPTDESMPTIILQ